MKAHASTQEQRQVQQKLNDLDLGASPKASLMSVNSELAFCALQW